VRRALSTSKVNDNVPIKLYYNVMFSLTITIRIKSVRAEEFFHMGCAFGLI